ncbi:MAG: ATP-binding protein [Candidatus Cloacimonetes bacterium]|nr:ATP-binding protein [Candidatus Cloacimonadota bacterium]
MKNLGIGIQELSEFKKRNLIYVDKTEIINKLITSGKYYFLSRPRRFGKSLLVNTIKEIYLGNKDLFFDTWIYNNRNWEEKNPIIKISFSSISYREQGLKNGLELFFDNFAKKVNLTYTESDYSGKFKELIEFLGEKDGVVILIDEYDKPIIDFLDKKSAEIAEKNKDILKNLYSGLKDCDKYIKLLFITGVSKFSRVSIFSELNNLTDITLSEKYSQIVGYTEKEIVKNYSTYFKIIENKFRINREILLKNMKLWYNGYSWDGDFFLYNPFSILNLFENCNFSNYWFKSGTPTFLTKLIKKQNIDIKKYDNSDFTIEDDAFDSYEIGNIDLNILLFQTGYLTIKKKIINPENFSISYKISYPNKEVRDSFYKFLISEFTEIDKTQFTEITKFLKESLEESNIEQFIIILKSLYANIPYEIFMKNAESYYHTIIYLILKLLGVKVFVEKHTNKGRIDAVIETKKYIFIIEFKMGCVNSALKQLKEKKYYEPYLSDSREIYNIGIAFDEKERNIKEYQVRTVEELEIEQS